MLRLRRGRSPRGAADLARMPLPSHLSSLALVRLLQEWAPAPGEPPRQDVAERLGEWLSAFDSVKLDGALQAIASYGASRPAAIRQHGQPVDVPALEAVYRRVRAELTDLVAAEAVPASSALTASSDTAALAGYGQHHQRYAALQQRMEAKVAACRAHVRQALSKGSPRLRQLAALDGVMAEMLEEREHKLLAAVPVYLERRFAHWRQMRQHKLAAAGMPQDDDNDPQHSLLAGAWLHGFQLDMRQMLLAELQLRLQPALGLIEAAQEEHRQSLEHQA